MSYIRSHLSNIELQKSKISLTWDPVEAKDAIHHMSPNLDQTIGDSLVHICKPGACGSELSPDHIHHVILIIIILLESYVFILRNDRKLKTDPSFLTSVCPNILISKLKRVNIFLSLFVFRKKENKLCEKDRHSCHWVGIESLMPTFQIRNVTKRN